MCAGRIYARLMSEPRPPVSAVVVPPPLDQTTSSGYPSPIVAASRKPFFHPLSGVVILLLDTVFFGVEVISLELALPLSCLLAFLFTGLGVFCVQKFLHRDGLGASLAKALLGGLAAGVPWSITGTIVGSWILLLSGLSAWDHRRRPN